MSELFITKAKQFILDNLENDKFGVSELAAEMGLSRSQFLRKIKSETGKSANKFIRDIRLEESISLIENDDHTASEIAYKVGFSSPSYFNKCFHDKYGCTPGEYKKQAGEEGFSAIETKETSTSNNRMKVAGMFLLFIIVTFGFGYWGANLSKPGEAETEEIAIAVLPFLDLSEMNNRSHLALGLTDNLITELSKMKGFRVTSRGSAMIFRDSVRIYSEIAEFLGADLLLEGSVLTEDDSMLVNVQLINHFPQEDHIWANQYYQRTTKILQVVSDLSYSIATEILNATQPTAPQELPEVDEQAHELYQKGRMLWMTQDIRKDKMKDAVEYLASSITIDPDFAPAYLTLAECYMALDRLVYDHAEEQVYRTNARAAVEKALELDQSLADAYTTKANLVGKLDWDWEQMKQLAEKAMELQPSNSDAHLVLSNYNTVKGDYKNAISEALTAKSLDPLNPRTLSFLAERYYIVGDYDKAIDTYNEVLELFPTFGFAMHSLGYVYLQQGFPEKSIEIWTELQDLMRNEAVAEYYRTGASFEDCVRFYMKGALTGEDKYCCNQAVVSGLFMMVDDPEGTIDYLKVAYEVRNEDLPFVLSYPLYYPLHNHPEFQELVNDIGVVFPQSNPL
ncbi:helix-turn-helix domain-containing protein [uncultured Draconibacterium sp.]|uniref:helix-turn-helix domain-containing protein n=1 Tax=uncultured Draconibacterium sp. TaxID=1573823 RepID=UPI0029C67A3F|nr:helix-turn-helix domain-containing protein [uncultured Draconibacterium sp.]